jgi:tetratricopeptide (TPR) repeat protein
MLSRMLGGIDALLANNDIAGAQHLVDRVVAVDPGHLDLPAARARLAEAVQRQQKALARDLDAADAALHGGRIDVAIAGYRKVQAANPNDPRARAGLRLAADTLVRQANRATADFDFASAESALAQAHALAPQSPVLRAAEQHLQQARARSAGLGHSGNNSAKIDDLLAAADHAIVRNELVDPPGDSAFDKLRAASAIAPGDPRVIAATRRFGATAVACFQREMTGNRLVRAEACLDALIATDPAYARLPSMRQALAARWLAVADERLGAGELDNAQRAIASAQRWAPIDPAIPALLTRLQQARAGIRH